MSVQIVRSNSIVVRAFAALTRFLAAGLLVLVLVPASPAHADTPVCDPIPVDTTWSSAGNNYIVTCILHVMEGATLTIEPGVRVHFEAGCGLRIDGGLIADGVTFVSNQVSPEPGDWSRIYFGPKSDDAVFDGSGNYLSGSKIQGSTIVYGGGGADIAGSIIIDGASPLLDGNIVRFSSTRGIWALGRSTTNKVVIRGNSVIDNNGGGIWVSAGELDHNTVSDNSGGDGAGIHATNSVLTENEVTNNQGRWGGGIYALGGALNFNTVSGNTGSANAFDAWGGGVYSDGSDLTGNLVSGNSIGNSYDWDAAGGGIYALGGTLSQNTVTGNVVTWGTGKGGGIFSSLGTLVDNVVNSNSVNGHDSSGGGIYSAGGSLTDNTVSGNTVNSESDDMSYGGGVYADGGILTNNIVSGNSASGGERNEGGGVYGRLNTITGNTLSHNSAQVGGAIYGYQANVIDNVVINNSTAMTGTVYMEQGTATANTVESNTAVYGGGLYGWDATLSSNTVTDNTANYGGGIYGQDASVLGNTVSMNSAYIAGGGIYGHGGTISENAVTENDTLAGGHGSGVYLRGGPEFTYNSVTGNVTPGGTSGGISIKGQPLVQFNNLHDNEPYDAEVISGQDVTGTLNYWGESLCTEIPWQIYDGHDLPGRGILSYAPSLYSPVPVAQLDAPSDLVMIEVDGDAVMLSWAPIDPIPVFGCRPPGYTDPDQGYSIHYSIGKPCGPYDGTGLLEGDSPINVGDVTSYELNGLGLGEYCFVVTAWDYLVRESAFTNSVCSTPEGYPIHLPLVMRSA